MQTELSEHIQAVYDAIIVKNLQPDLLPDREMKRQGDEYRTLCPFHSDSHPSFDISASKPVYICRSCGLSGDWIQLVGKLKNGQGATITGELFSAALAELERIAGIPSRTVSPQDRIKYEASQTRFAVLAEAMDFFKSELSKNPNALKYLTDGRGYTADDIDKMELGYFPGADKTLRYLEGKGFTTDDIFGQPDETDSDNNGALTWMQSRAEYEIVFPYTSPGGSILSIYGRPARTVQGGEAKYKPFRTMQGKIEKYPFNLNAVKDFKTVVLVEGFFDALLLTARGIDNVVAVSGQGIKSKQLETLIKYGTTDFILALDNDNAGRGGTRKAIAAIQGKNKRAYVVTLPDGFKDPDELVSAKGIEAFRELTDRAEPGYCWELNQEYAKTDLANGISASHFWDCVKNIEKTLQDPTDRIRLQKTLQVKTGHSADQIQDIFQEQLERREQAGRKEATRRLLSDGLQRLDSEPDLDLADLQTRIGKLDRRGSTATTPLEARLEAQFQVEESREPGGLLGFDLDKLGIIAEDADGIQPGFYIIAGYANVGKTALITNIYMDAVLTNEKMHGIYYSFDDSENFIISRLLSIICDGEIEINDSKRKQRDPTKKTAIDRARAKMLELATSGRMDIKDATIIQTIEQLERDIKNEVTRIGKENLFIAIDGLHNLDVTSEHDALRGKHIKIAERIKYIVDSCRVPIMTTVEVRKDGGKSAKKEKLPNPTMHDIMESGKYLYNANMIYLIYPKDPDEYDNGAAAQYTVIVKTEKNKLSGAKEMRDFMFLRKSGILRQDRGAINGQYDNWSPHP